MPGKGVHGVVMQGYWCDVGTPRAYYQCCLDALDGKLRLPDVVSGETTLPQSGAERPSQEAPGVCAI
jgi:NDP-sugar pyrophosphorylase family protein